MAKEFSKRILLIEDDADILEVLRYVLEGEGYSVYSATNGADALNLLKTSNTTFDVILSDIQMPLIDGQSLLKKLKEMENKTPIILMTAYGTIPMAVEAIRNGAHDFLTKPIQFNDLKQTLQKALEYSKIVYADGTDEKIEAIPTSNDFVGESPAMKKIFALVHRIARVDSTVLILGESGVGKEVLAREIHQRSPRKNNNFIAINCAAIPAELLESELFGHTKGSFTGALAQKKGLFEEAQGGTLFLDEVGDMAPALQAKLLRVLQERKIRPIGSNVTRDLDVRIIAATHRNLRSAIVEGTFREDLFYRLSVIPVVIPPLRERTEDIRPLAVHFAKRASRAINEGYKTFSEEALDILRTFPWPGNVRELENVVERCLVMSPRNVIKAQDLEFLGANKPVSTSIPILEPAINPQNLCLKDLEKEAVILALKQTDGKKAAAARLLGIDRKTLHRKEQEYGLN